MPRIARGQPLSFIKPMVDIEVVVVDQVDAALDYMRILTTMFRI